MVSVLFIRISRIARDCALFCIIAYHATPLLRSTRRESFVALSCLFTLLLLRGATLFIHCIYRRSIVHSSDQKIPFLYIMWDGVGGHGDDEEGSEQDSSDHLSRLAALTSATESDQRSRLAALASAAFANSGVDVASFASRYDQGYEYPVSHLAQANRSLLYQSQAVEALRHREEMQLRQQALYTLQQQRAYQQQEMQELEYARQLQQQQRAAELAELTRREAFHHHEGLSVLEAVGRIPVKEPRHRTEVEDEEQSKERKDPSQAEPTVDSTGYLSIAPRGKPEAMVVAMAADRIQEENEGDSMVTAVPVADDTVAHAQAEITTSAPVASPAKKKPKKRKASTSPHRPKKKGGGDAPTLDDPVPPITEVEYENIEALLEQFCKVPLLSEFSRPVSLLHPEVRLCRNVCFAFLRISILTWVILLF